jgi:hypothetical protein
MNATNALIVINIMISVLVAFTACLSLWTMIKNRDIKDIFYALLYIRPGLFAMIV